MHYSATGAYKQLSREASSIHEILQPWVSIKMCAHELPHNEHLTPLALAHQQNLTQLRQLASPAFIQTIKNLLQVFPIVLEAVL